MQMSFRHSVGANFENGLYFPSAVLSLDYDASESWRASCCMGLWVVCSQSSVKIVLLSTTLSLIQTLMLIYLLMRRVYIAYF